MLYIVRCYDGTDTTLSVKNCIEDDLLDVPEWKRTGSLPRDYLSLTLSVSETAEWVCTKTVYNNNTVRRGCHKTYTGNYKDKTIFSNQYLGGERFAMCFWSDSAGTGCSKVNDIN